MTQGGSQSTHDTDPEQALFDDQFDTMVVCCYADERPLQGLAGRLDWRFAGALSFAIRSGAITGKAGELAYVPIAKAGKTFHLIAVGAGDRPKDRERASPPAETVAALQRNLSTLNRPAIGISRSDWGDASDSFFNKHFRGINLWIAR